MKRNLLAFLLCAFSTSLLAQGTFMGTLQNGDLTFNRPNEGVPPTTFSSFNNVRYDVYPLEMASAGLVTVWVTSSFDNFAILYDKAGFFPAIPLTNALVANDDFIEQNAGFSYNVSSAGRYYIVVCSFKNNVSGSYALTVSSGTLLPLKLLSFTATRSGGNNNIIKWTSAEESDLLHYQVQKSVDNIVFKDLPLGVVPASNNVLGHSYNFSDENPGTGNVYYRLKIYEKSGLVSFSPIAVVKQSIALTVSAFPNPTVDFLQLEMKTMQGKQVLVSVTNSTGAIVQSGQYRFNSLAFLKLNVGNLAAGVYFIKITSATHQSDVSFIKR